MVTIIGEGQLVDHHTLADHKVPNYHNNGSCTKAYMMVMPKGFNGKGNGSPKCSKTNAFQQNNNILLTDKASVDTKPQLEIYADDVQCSHGCTIGQLDEDAMFYMQAEASEAKALLLYAFANIALGM